MRASRRAYRLHFNWQIGSNLRKSVLILSALSAGLANYTSLIPSVPLGWEAPIKHTCCRVELRLDFLFCSGTKWGQEASGFLVEEETRSGSDFYHAFACSGVALLSGFYSVGGPFRASGH